MSKSNQSLQEWAKAETDLLIEESSEEAGKLYSTAFSAFQTLASTVEEDPSINFGKLRDVMINLLFHQPLSPIEDVEESWELLNEDPEDTIKLYQCVRHSTLYKEVDETSESTRYIDTGRYVCVDVNCAKRCWTGGIGAKILEEMYPIKFPYTPCTPPIRVYMERFRYHEDPEETEWGDFDDTLAVTHIQLPDGELIEVFRFFKQMYKRGSGKTQFEPDIFEIDKTEYFSRKAAWKTRVARKAKKENKER